MPRDSHQGKNNGLVLFGRGDQPSADTEGDETLAEPSAAHQTVNELFSSTRYTGMFASSHYSDFRPLWVGRLGWSGANWMGQVARNRLIWAQWVLFTILLDASKAKSVSKTSSANGQLKEGISYVISNKNILMVMIVALAVFTFVIPYNTLMPMMANEVLDIGAQGFGLLLSLASIGALIGRLAVATFNDIRHKGMLFHSHLWPMGSSCSFSDSRPISALVSPFRLSS